MLGQPSIVYMVDFGAALARYNVVKPIDVPNSIIVFGAS